MAFRIIFRTFADMNEIRLECVTPNVFADKGSLASDVWQQDVTLERGKTYLVEAASGTGKSSLCSFLYGYRDDYQGRILFDGEDIRTYRRRAWVDIRQKHMSQLFQELRLFPEMTAWENVAIKNQLTDCQSRETIESWFERLGIAACRDKRLAHMSFGQQQRVGLIRALCQPFDFLLADEPVSHLDEDNSRVMGDIMKEEAARQGAALILTSIGKHIELKYDKILKL